MAPSVVRLNVYDMYWLNDYAANIGVGIYHSGIEIHGVEYAYGGHPFEFTGIFENQPQDAEELGENFKFRESIVIGESDFKPHEVRELIKSLGQRFRGDKYHLMTRNCNHFSSEFSKLLTGNEIPGWINRLANISKSIPLLERVLPPEWLTPVALQQQMNSPPVNSNGHLRRASVSSAEEALETSPAPLSERQDRSGSRTTMLSGRAGGELSSSSSNSSEDGGRASGSNTPQISRFFNQIRSALLPNNDVGTTTTATFSPRQ